MKKRLALTVAILSSLNLFVSASPIVELAAPRLQSPQVMQDSGASNQSPISRQTASKTKEKIILHKRHKIHYSKKIHRQPKIDYDDVSKLIEYGYYDDADKILTKALNYNSKDIKAGALWVVSLAKQRKLEPAQNELNILLKNYPKNSNLHYAQGVVYYQRTTSSNMTYRKNSQKLFNDALNEFDKAIEFDKNNAKAYNAAGVISLRLNNAKNAKSYFQNALKIDKTYSMALDNLGTMDFTDGKVNDAESKFKQSLDYNTQNTTAMYHLAQVEIQKQNYAKALYYLNNALAINSNSAAVYNLIGKAYLAQGNEAAAINAFNQSIMVKPEFTISYLDLADVYEKRGDNEFAMEKLKSILSIEPNFYDAKLKLADISLGCAKYKQAIDTYSELVGIDDYNDPALKGLADAYYGQAIVSSSKSIIGSNKELFNALDSINKAIAANNQDLELHLAKLKLAKLTNQPELTKAELNKIIEGSADNLTNNVVKGEAYLTLNDYMNAEKTFDSAINLSKNTEDDLYLSEILIYHKQYNCAEKVINKILKEDKANQEALSNLDYINKCKKYAESYFQSANHFVKSKNLAAAEDYLSRSLAFNPNNAQARLLLATIYEKRKDYQNALVNYKAYIGLEPNTPYTKKINKKIQSYENRL